MLCRVALWTSELILCFTICVHSATRHNIHVYIIVRCYVGVDVTQPNWQQACNENCFGEVDQDDMFILQSNAMSELMSFSLTGIKPSAYPEKRPSILCIQ